MSRISTKHLQELLGSTGYKSMEAGQDDDNTMFGARDNGNQMVPYPDYCYPFFKDEDIQLLSLAPVIAQEVISLRGTVDRITSSIDDVIQDYYDKAADASHEIVNAGGDTDIAELERFRDMCHLIIDQLEFVKGK